MAEPDNLREPAALDATGSHHNRVTTAHPPLRTRDVPAPFSFQPTHVLSSRVSASSNADRTPVMFIDRWGYTEDTWRLGSTPPFVWTWQGFARSATGEELVIHDLERFHGLCGLDWELRPSIDRYRDLLPHEMESRPAFFATHEVSSAGRQLGVMVIRGYGYTEAEWEMESPPSFLDDRDGGVVQFPDGGVLGEDGRVRRLEPGYGAWWDRSAQIGRVALITPQGIQSTPWTWRAETQMDLRDGEIRPFMDLSSRRALAGHFAALVQVSPDVAGAERAWIARKLLSPEFSQPSDGFPAWEVRAQTIARWLEEARDNPAAAELVAINYPWVPTHRMEFHCAWGDPQDDVMVVGDRAFTEEGWNDGTADYAKMDREWLHSSSLAPGCCANHEARVVEAFESRALGVTDPSTGQRHVLVAGPRGVAEVTVAGQPLDWTTPQGRREAATALVRRWMASSDYSFELTARLTAEAMLACRSDVAWSVVRGDFLAALRGDVMVGRALTPPAAQPPMDRPPSVLQEPSVGPPSFGPPL